MNYSAATSSGRNRSKDAEESGVSNLLGGLASLTVKIVVVCVWYRDQFCPICDRPCLSDDVMDDQITEMQGRPIHVYCCMCNVYAVLSEKR